MKNLYITTTPAKIKRESNQLVIESMGNRLCSIPVSLVNNIFLFGNIELTMPFVNFALSRGVYIFLLSPDGRMKGMISPPVPSSNCNNRLLQYKTMTRKSKCLSVAKYIVTCKIMEISRILKKNPENLSEKMQEVSTLQELLGVEGSHSAAYFDSFRKRLSSTFKSFKKREYHPSPDPVNALLSLVYTIFHLSLIPQAVSSGFDPFLGILHKKRGAHPAFCSDLMEPFRPDISEFVLNYLNRGNVKESDFEYKEAQCRLSSDQIRSFLKAYTAEIGKNQLFLEKIEKFVSELAAQM